MKVKRIVDTVIVEMDIDVAEKLLEVLGQVSDSTRMGVSYPRSSSLEHLASLLESNAEVRTPSALHIADVTNGHVYLRDTTSDEFDVRRAVYLDYKGNR